MGEATRVLASYLYDCTNPTLSGLCIELTYFFFGEILCPERQNYLKNLRFFFFLCSEKNTLELNILAKYWNLPGMTKTLQSCKVNSGSVAAARQPSQFKPNNAPLKCADP